MSGITSVTSSELVRDWLGWLERSKGRGQGTLRVYRRVCEEFLRFADGRPLDGLSAGEIERWVQRPRWGQRAQGQVASPATQNRDVTVVRGLYGYGVARGWLQHDPSLLVSTPRIKNLQPRPIPDEMWARLWQAVDDADAILLGLGFFGGLRRAELTNLRVSNVSLGERKIVNFVRKGGGEDSLNLGTMLDVFERRLPHLGAGRLWPLIERQVRERDGNGWLVGWSDVGRPDMSNRSPQNRGQLDPSHVNKWLDRVAARAEVEHVNPHRLRHSCATNLLRAGVPLPYVSAALNHSSYTTTQRYLKAGGDALSEWLGGQR